jgi:thiol-disulfide isomerase/thioredoxin
MNRRSWMGWSAGVAVVAGGAGWLARQRTSERHHPNAAPTIAGATAPAPTTAASDSGSGDLWSLQFDRPEGGTLALASLRGRPLLVNFWATWCPPCVKEMPLLDAFARAQAARGAAGWQVIGLAVDGPTPVREFLKKTPVGFPIGLAGFGGTELARQLGNTTGGLPYTVVLGADGQVLHRKLGETNVQELQSWADAVQRGTTG